MKSLDQILVLGVFTLATYGGMMVVDKTSVLPITVRDMVWVLVGAAVSAFGLVLWRGSKKA